MFEHSPKHLKNKILRKESSVFQIYCVLIGLFVFSVTLFRAATTCMTYDESYTYMYYAMNFSFDQIIKPQNNLANNHILNTMMIFLFDKIFGAKYNELVIRMPALISFAVYLYGSYYISKTHKLRYVLFPILTMNYYLNEFFGLARGYSIAATFILLSLIFGCKYYKTHQSDRRSIAASIIFAILASFSNTISLLYLFCLVVIILIFLLRNKLCVFLIMKEYIILIIFSFTAVLYLLFFHYSVTVTGKPLYGGHEISNVFNYGFSWMLFRDGKRLLQCFLLFILICGIIISKGRLFGNYDFILTGLLYVMLIFPFLILRMPFPLTRLLLPFWPVLAVGFTAVISEICEGVKKIKLLPAAAVITLSLLVFSYSSQFDLKKTFDWGRDYKIRDIAYASYAANEKIPLDRYDSETWMFYRQKIIYFHGFDIFGE